MESINLRVLLVGGGLSEMDLVVVSHVSQQGLGQEGVVGAEHVEADGSLKCLDGLVLELADGLRHVDGDGLGIAAAVASDVKSQLAIVLRVHLALSAASGLGTLFTGSTRCSWLSGLALNLGLLILLLLALRSDVLLALDSHCSASTGQLHVNSMNTALLVLGDAESDRVTSSCLEL